MKALKIVLGIILLLVIAAVIASLATPTEMKVERSIEINASPAAIQPYVTHLEKMHDWSPWAELDTNQKVEYVGEDGTIGAIMKWEGNEDVGKGEQEITAISDNRVDTDLRFIEPYESEADAYTILEEIEPGKTKVTWGFDSEMARPMNIMMLFMDMDAALGADFEKGLSNLKALVEAEAPVAGSGDFTIEEITFPETFYIMVKDSISWDAMQAFFGEHFGALYEAAGAAGKQPGVPTGMYFTWDTVNKTTNMAAAIPVAPAGEVGKFESMTLGGNALQIDYYGSYEGSESAHNALGEYIIANGKTMNGPAVEQYITDPTTEPDTSKWLTKIIYFVQ